MRKIRLNVVFIMVLCVISLVFAYFTRVTFNTIDEIKVNGDLYKQIIQGKDIVADILPPPEYIIEAYLTVHLISRSENDSNRAQLIAYLQTLEQQYQERHKFWSEELSESELKRELTSRSYQPSELFFRIVENRFIPAIQNNDRKTAEWLLTHELKQKYEEHRASIDKVVSIANRRITEVEAQGKNIIADRIKTLNTAQFLIYGFLLLLSITFVWSLSTVIRRLRKEIATVAEGAIGGKLDVRGNLNSVNIEFAGIVQDFNQTIDAFVEPMRLTSKYTNMLANGVLPERIESKYQGEFATMIEDVNRCSSAIGGLAGEVNRLIDAAQAGSLNHRTNSTGMPNEYGKILKGLNKALDAMIGPLNMAAEKIDKLSKGEIPLEITDPYRGDFNIIKSNLNQCFGAIRRLVEDANMLSREAVKGKLSVRADVSPHQGDYRKIIQGFNETLDAVIEPLTVAADYIDEISHGNIPPRNTNVFNGDFLIIISNLNNLIDVLHGLLDAQAEMSRQHDLGMLEFEMPVSQFEGSYAELAKRINTLVKSHIAVTRTVVEVVGRYANGDLAVDMDRLPGQKSRITEAID